MTWDTLCILKKGQKSVCDANCIAVYCSSNYYCWERSVCVCVCAYIYVYIVICDAQLKCIENWRILSHTNGECNLTFCAIYQRRWQIFLCAVSDNSDPRSSALDIIMCKANPIYFFMMTSWYGDAFRIIAGFVIRNIHWSSVHFPHKSQ